MADFIQDWNSTPAPDDTLSERSEGSQAFEKKWLEACGDNPIPARDEINLRRFAPFAPRMALIEPDRQNRTLPIRLAGSGLYEVTGFDVTGRNYLDFVAEEIRENAYRDVITLLDHPCGLWQITPFQMNGMPPMPVEYTLLPISLEGGTTADLAVVLVTYRLDLYNKPIQFERIEHSKLWSWIDLGHGIAKKSRDN